MIPQVGNKVRVNGRSWLPNRQDPYLAHGLVATVTEAHCHPTMGTVYTLDPEGSHDLEGLFLSHDDVAYGWVYVEIIVSVSPDACPACSGSCGQCAA